MAFDSSSKGGAVAAINVTPLVDVVLVLLIIFMVVTPMLQRGKPVVLPNSKHADEGEQDNPLMISVTNDKKLWVESDEVDEETLEKAVRDELTSNPRKPMMVKGDSELTVGDVRRVFKSVQKGGARSVALAVEQAKEAGQ